MTQPTRTLLLELRHPGRLGQVEVTEIGDDQESLDLMRQLGWVPAPDHDERHCEEHDVTTWGVPCPMCPQANGHPVKVGETMAGEEVFAAHVTGPTLSAPIAARVNGGGNGFGTIGARLDALIEVLEEERAR